ncbi:putative feruloyl esterase [Tothia fuscella]|uniref:Carboxylic ester hydrolase n=1 Tax=Tothia fuscella TaxID=1048955 RepID=A0A9P4TVP0_9PEZI|nr:putative feruloyl esterase [Tothia fuscella]
MSVPSLQQLAAKCTSQAIKYSSTPDLQVMSLDANVARNFSKSILEPNYWGHGSMNISNVNFCNITITHTHLGLDDKLRTYIWLPLENWNNRLQAQGGGGWLAGMYPLADDSSMIGSVADGYAAVSTDGGHMSLQLADWVLKNPGELDLIAFQNFAFVSLNDTATIAKEVIKSFYGKLPRFSYWNGCSNGGRQGYELAQRYPGAFDALWPLVILDEQGQYPHSCELNSLTAVAIQECDLADGVQDGIISNPDACKFDPDLHNGTIASCVDDGCKISQTAVRAAKAAWTGPLDVNELPLWYGLGFGATITKIVQTNCSSSICIGNPNPLSTEWLRLVVQKDPSFSVKGLSRTQIIELFQKSIQDDAAMFSAANTDLSSFRQRGGKLLTFHGLSDEIVPYKGTRHYHDSVKANDTFVNDYYRVFESPSFGHCRGWNGHPTNAFNALVDWVEYGRAPDTLYVKVQENGRKSSRILCPYPQRAIYHGTGNITSIQDFKCGTLGLNLESQKSKQWDKEL